MSSEAVSLNTWASHQVDNRHGPLKQLLSVDLGSCYRETASYFTKPSGPPRSGPTFLFGGNPGLNSIQIPPKTDRLTPNLLPRKLQSLTDAPSPDPVRFIYMDHCILSPTSMAFSTHNSSLHPDVTALSIQLPGEVHYNYSSEGPANYPSSVESDSPYTPNFPSPLLVPYIHDDAGAQQVTDMYRGECDQRQTWFDRDPYFNDQNVLVSSELPKTASAVAFTAGLPLHAPTPLPRTSSLLFSDAENLNYPILRQPPSPQSCPSVGYLSSATHMPCGANTRFTGATHRTDERAHVTFPTPSELLVELATKNGNSEEPRSEKKTETARKARQRAVAQSVGFVPTDPDTISSHEKKRHYLECVEQYVMYLHQQLQLVGSEPVKLERVSNYRGLSSRSIRTLLVHMENCNRKLNLRTLGEEQRFITLRDAICKQGAAAVEEYQCQAVSEQAYPEHSYC
ncbi:hypothetical protein BDZ94DRAFT_1322237 [Collybia nuda]|uniref:Uncharacterized protein n=1 Tax=Collybia nuda TaxID=64659 RepID=A0A9P6CI44_9AGAR|nr:hypothetical protein BDZ94DRAFT_1322237 [Collybia nuda]